MTRPSHPQISWHPALPEPSTGPIYRVLADLMAADIASGKLRPGQRLPTHRALAEALSVDLTTVTRAYNEARRRGLIDAAVGRGTFVREPDTKPARREEFAAAIDTGMNLPPQPASAALRQRLADTLAELLRRPDVEALLTYRANAGSEADRAAGAAWLRPLLPEATPERVLVFAGAQTALLALLTTYIRSDDLIVTEALTYPGFRAMAGQLGLRVKGLAMDAEGLLPDALEEACRRDRPKALYCVPTIHNPTTATMSPARRHAIAAIARRYELLIFEDDAYGFLPAEPLPPLSALLPESSFYIASLAKCLTPGLRIAYVLAPGASQVMRLAGAIRATFVMAPPLTAAVATQWIGDGTAHDILTAIRRESVLRQKIAAEILPKHSYAAHPQGHHLWLTLPPSWSGPQFAGHTRQFGLGIVAGEAFAVDPAAVPNGVRIALGAMASASQLRGVLTLAADALQQLPSLMSNIV